MALLRLLTVDVYVVPTMGCLLKATAHKSAEASNGIWKQQQGQQQQQQQHLQQYVLWHPPATATVCSA